MATRRSTRIKNPPTARNESPEIDEQDPPVQAVIVERTKAKSTKAATKNATAATKSAPASKKNAAAGREAKSTASKTGTKATDSNAGIVVVGAEDNLSSLSPEIFGMMAENIVDLPSISALARTSKGLYALMMPRLYGRVAVAAMFHAHIPKLIRTLEPLLTIGQKKQLKKEGKYKGQQEKYPTGLDEKKTPICASYVKQMVIGAVDPGKKHKYIVERYLEEVLKNLANIEVLETYLLTKPICEGIASLDNLKALRIITSDLPAEDCAPLAQVKNLKHLDVTAHGYEFSTTFQAILRNSVSTIQSLGINADYYSCQFLDDWEKNLKSDKKSNHTKDSTGHGFTALRCLHLAGVLVDEEFIKEFYKAIDFSQLREFSGAGFRDTDCLFFPSLSDLITSYQVAPYRPFHLRTLNLDLSDIEYVHDADQEKAIFEAKCQFIASFNTLATLKLPNYGQYPENSSTTNPGLSQTLLQAILKHKNLRELRICYQGKMSGKEIPYLGPNTVGEIVDGLPQLREFEFAPDENRMDRLSQALHRGSQLESITCFPHASWASFPTPDNPGVTILSHIISTFLTNFDADKIDSKTKKVVWEEHTKLRRVSVSYLTWDVASKFGKRRKGGSRPEKIEIVGPDGVREAWYQLVPEVRRIHVGFDPEFHWVDKASRELQ